MSCHMKCGPNPAATTGIEVVLQAVGVAEDDSKGVVTRMGTVAVEGGGRYVRGRAGGGRP